VRATPSSHGRLVAAAALTSTGAIAAQVMGRATRDALFLSNFEVARLPQLMLAGAAASLGAAFWAGRLIARFSPARVMPVAFAASGLLLASYATLAESAPRAIAIALSIHMAVFGATLVSTFWSALNERFDPRTAKRYVGWIAGAGTAGGILGGLAALGAAHALGTRDSLFILAGLHLVCAGSCLRFGSGGRSNVRAQVEPSRAVPSALRVLREVSYLRKLALLVGTVAAMEALADYVLNAQAAATWSERADLMGFFALFHMTVAGVTFALQTLLGRAGIERLGLVGSIATLPLFAIPGSALAALIPRLWSAGLLRGAMAGLGNSLYRSGYELLFSPLPVEKKRPTKTVIDVAFDRMGTAAGSAITLSTVALAPAFTRPLLLGGVFVLAVLALGTIQRLNVDYVRSLEESIKSSTPPDEMKTSHNLGLSQTMGRLDRTELMREIESLRHENLLVSSEMASPFAWFGASSEGGAGGPDPLLARTAALLSGDPEAIRAELDAHDLDPRLAGVVIPLLAREDVGQDAVRALRKVADRFTGQLTDALLDPTAPFVVRRRVARAMSGCTTQRAVDGLLKGLADDRFEVRYQCGLSLGRLTRDTAWLSVSKEIVLAAVKREVTLERSLWQHKPPLDTSEDEADSGLVDTFLRDRTSRSLEHVFAILSLVFEREPMRLALRALAGDDEARRGTALEYLEQVLPADVKTSLWPFLAASEVVGRG